MQKTPSQTPPDSPKKTTFSLKRWLGASRKTSKKSEKKEIIVPAKREERYKPPFAGLVLLQLLILAFLTIFVSRFWFLQIHKGAEYSLQAQKNYGRAESIQSSRGRILDAKGRTLADNKKIYGLALVADRVDDVPATLAQISVWTGLPLEHVHERYRQGRLKSKPFEPIRLATDIPTELVVRIESEIHRWPGVKIVLLTKRTYPEGELFSHILGYVAEASESEIAQKTFLAMGDIVGKSGIEFTMDERLRGEKGYYEIAVDATGHILERNLQKEPLGGEDLRLSIDLDIQRACWSALQGEVGSIVVMEPDTGKLRALVTTPSYDNNLFAAGISQKDWNELISDPRAPLQNRAIQSTYPPGSVWKLVMATAFLENKVDPRNCVFCGGSARLGKQIFRCWKHSGHGSQNMLSSISNSCDVYYYITADRVGIDRLESFAKAAGFGSRTGIDLPHERKGLVPSKEWKRKRFKRNWGRGDTFNASIGQGFVLATPLQVANYVCSLLNGGKILKPGLVETDPPQVRGRIPASRQSLDFVVECMRRTANGGTAKVMHRADADMGGKTGTAQVVRLKGRGQSYAWKERDHAWIATWGMKGQKRYVVVVMVEHGGGGSSKAGPIAKRVYDTLFSNPDYYDNPNYYKTTAHKKEARQEFVGPPAPPKEEIDRTRSTHTSL